MRVQSLYTVFDLAIAPGVTCRVLASLLALQRAEQPELRIQLHQVSIPDLLQGVHTGRYKAGIAYTAGAASPNLQALDMWLDDLAVALPERSPLLAHPQIPLNALQTYQLIRWTAPTCPDFDLEMKTLLARDNTARTSMQCVDSFELMATLASAGYGVGIALRSRIVEARNWGVVMRPFDHTRYRVKTQLLWPLRPEEAAVEQLAERARRIVSALASSR
ncbi:LysR substrate-binding domain-containing protein [Pseudomonas sp. FME51]|uniref:LysR substrate-binding domain-containing protein n=1 Tax=Pseudomonas sp. FME51 TaxID=2742609 RepID=UPI001865C722|nr:LysR substrate-binding domain-containing protein [Pseudomonas sp. FME51]